MHITAVTGFIFLLFRVVTSESNRYTCTTNTVSAFEVVNGPIKINTDSLDPFESTKLSAVNSTSFECWYFDAVSRDGTSGSSVVFFRDPSVAIYGSGHVRVDIAVVWRNGTRFSESIFVEDSSLTVCEQFTRGIWSSVSKGVEISFRISKNLKTVEINVSSPRVSGSFLLQSRTPARYPDGQLYPSRNASVALAPLIYWNEAIPSGTAEVSLVVGNTEFEIARGVGGHDRSYAPFTWDVIVKEWAWMRFVAGPYTMVYWGWHSAIDGKFYNSAFLTEHGKVVFTATKGVLDTSGNFVVFRRRLDPAAGVHGSFPDKTAGFEIFLEDGKTGKEWYFLEEHRNVVFEAPHEQSNAYTRFVGIVSGHGPDGKEFRGVAVSEQNSIYLKMG